VTALAHARNSDPQTSRDAANSVNNVTDLQARLLQLFEKPHVGYTDEELIREYAKSYLSWFPASESSIRSRRSELVHRGELRASELKRLTKNDRPSTVWMLSGVIF